MTHLTFERISSLADVQSEVGPGGVEGRHLQECADCREQLRALRQLLERAHTLPRTIEPPAEAWNAIRARLPRTAPRQARWHAGRWMAAAAAVILLVGGALVLPFGGGTTRNLKGAKLPISERVPAAVAAVEQQYGGTVNELRQALDAQRPVLASGVAGVVDRSLADIDAAITETRAALVSDPGNPALVDILSAHYERKVDLLQRATELATSD